MSLEHKYALVLAEDINDLDIEQIEATFDYDVIIEPTQLPDGNYFVEYCGNKPYTLYGTTVYTEAEAKAIRKDPDGPYHSPDLT